MPTSRISVDILQSRQLYYSINNCKNDNNALKQYLLQALRPMNKTRTDWGWLNSAEKKAKFAAEEVLMSGLNSSQDPDETIRALGAYHRSLAEYPGIQAKGNTWAFLDQTACLCPEPVPGLAGKNLPEKVKVDIKKA